MVDIYYTVAPSSLPLAKELIQAGASGARLTFSFGTPGIQHERARELKSIAHTVQKPFEIIADLEGGGLRLGEISIGGHSIFSVVTDEIISYVHAKKVTEKALPVSDKSTFDSLTIGDRLIVGDNNAVFDVVGTDQVKALFDAEVESSRGLYVQGGVNTFTCLTEKDRSDIQEILTHPDLYDSIALSFVSQADEVTQVREMCLSAGVDMKIIAKIETGLGLNNIKEICAAADTIMVARGDLALDLPWCEMPKAVDAVVETCLQTDTPYIMATQVAESMGKNQYMTRAEMTDLWQWKQRGAQGVLLSREVAWGDHPVLVVEHVQKLLSA